MTVNNRHDCFIGRWVYFHAGHEAIIRKVWEKNRRRVLILIMDTEEATTAQEREMAIGDRLKELGILHAIRIIPPIASVNWGRKVGYERNYIDVDEAIQAISATQIGDELNRKVMPCRMCSRFREYDQRCRKTWTPLHNGYAMMRNAESCGGPYPEKTHPLVAIGAILAFLGMLPFMFVYWIIGALCTAGATRRYEREGGMDDT